MTAALTTPELTEHIRQLVDSAPPISEAVRDRIAALIGVGA